MTRRTLWAGILTGLLAVSTAFPQEHDLAGTWQGTLHSPDRYLRIVIKVTKDANGYKATTYSIDQGAQPIPAASITAQGGNVKITVPAIGGVYEGKFSNTDGNTITGNWSQGGPNSLPLDLTLANEKTAWAIPEPPPLPTPMAENADPSWEASTIKPSDPDRQGIGINMNGRNFSTRNTTLRDLLTFTYGLHPNQIIGAPGWVETDKFDLAARPDMPGMPSDAQIKNMMKKLIAERFKLKFHNEKKELSVFLITVAKGGPKLTKNDTDPKGLPGLGFRGLGNLRVRNGNMSDFAQMMQARVLDRPVVNQTGLEGRYDFTLQWTPDETQFGGQGARAQAQAAEGGQQNPDLFTAMQQQLGLRIEATKAPADVFVIEHVEKPSDN
jgi:uncharacterized protein (TIGR03435 family)